MIPILKEKNIQLALEPNTAEYGADFLTNYTEVINLHGRINSPWVVPQIDTGCMWLAGDDLVQSFNDYMPEHIHLSVPYLELVPGDFNFENFLKVVLSSKYAGWLVIEMLRKSDNVIKEVDKTLYWLRSQFWGIENAR